MTTEVQACRYPLMDVSFLFSWIATLLVLWAVIPLFSFFCIPPSDENIYHCYSLFETLTDHGDTATSIAFVCFIFTLFIGLFMNCYLNCIYESGFGEPESSLKVLVASARLTWCFALLSFLSSIGMLLILFSTVCNDNGSCIPQAGTWMMLSACVLWCVCMLLMFTMALRRKCSMRKVHSIEAVENV